MNHIALAIVFLAVMVVFLVIVGVYQLRAFNRMALRIKYLEGTTDMILQILNPAK
jgi:hypothetical protein